MTEHNHMDEGRSENLTINLASFMFLSSFDGLLMSDSHLPKKHFFICFNDSPSKMMKNAFISS